MKGDWCYWNRYFSKEQCEFILEQGLKIPPQDAGLGTEGIKDESRRSKIRWIYPNNPDFQFVFDALWKTAISSNRDWFNFHITNLPFIQLAEYDESYQGEYRRHHDVLWMNDSEYHRKLTCVIQLSDPITYDGGDFEIFVKQQPDNKEAMRDQGTAIFIPSFVYHQANPVTRGTRYSLTAWFEGPKWR